MERFNVDALKQCIADDDNDGVDDEDADEDELKNLMTTPIIF